MYKYVNKDIIFALPFLILSVCCLLVEIFSLSLSNTADLNVIHGGERLFHVIGDNQVTWSDYKIGQLVLCVEIILSF